MYYTYILSNIGERLQNTITSHPLTNASEELGAISGIGTNYLLVYRVVLWRLWSPFLDALILRKDILRKYIYF